MRAQAALERRRRMRASAEKLFMRDGYEPTSMLSIAAEARVAERTLYLGLPVQGGAVERDHPSRSPR